MSTQLEPIVTVADLDSLPDDGNHYEIIAGELFVSKAPGIAHQRVFGDLFDQLRSYLKEHPIGEVIAAPGVVMSGADAVIPDLVVIRNERMREVITGDRVTAAPDLVVEILSSEPESNRRDRIAKRQLYGKFGVQEYWILDPEKKNVEVYVFTRNALRLASTLGGSDVLTSTTLAGLCCPISSLFR